MTGRRKLEGPVWERHSRGLTAAWGSPSSARSSLPAMCTTWANRPLSAPSMRHPGHPPRLPSLYLHSDLTRLLGGSRGEGDLDPRMPRGPQQRPLWWHQAGVGHRAGNHKEPREVGYLAVSPEPLGVGMGSEGTGSEGSQVLEGPPLPPPALPPCSSPAGLGSLTFGASSSRRVSRSLQLSSLRVLTTTSRQRRARGGTRSSHRPTSCRAWGWWCELQGHTWPPHLPPNPLAVPAGRPARGAAAPGPR